MKLFLDALKIKVSTWKDGNYEGVYSETRNILKYICNNGYLRQPQIEAFETYVYLKEILGNKPMQEIIKEVLPKEEIIKNLWLSQEEMMDIVLGKKKIEDFTLAESDEETSDYSNQVYALTMGTGKTVLMTVYILYDVVLSYYHPEDVRFAKNFVVFAPDTTIISSLKEIKSFDTNLVIPKEYQNALLQVKYHYLEDTKTKLTIPEFSDYNIIVTNSQKIIVKTYNPKNDLQKTLFWDGNQNEKMDIENARFTALKSLNNLSIFIDEAHHSFGTTLEGNIKKLKETINRIHKDKALVNCINMTGTPYINGEMIQDVVYYYGLKNGIEDGILKQAEVIEYGEVKDTEFLSNVVSEFWKEYGEERIEGKLPKIAIYTASIDELREVRRALETDIFKKLHIDGRKIIENHSEASKTEIQEFETLDTKQSEKQFILLVNKGTEGWNCKSLFATALYRKPPQIFTLQATTRCLRAIWDNSKKARIFLSRENYKILDKELKLNFDIDIGGLTGIPKQTQPIECKVEKRKVIKVKKVQKTIKAVKRNTFDSFKIDWNNYKWREIYRNIKELSLQNGKAIYTEWKLESNSENIGNLYDFYEILWVIERNTHIEFSLIKKILQNSNIERVELEKIISEDNYKIYYIIDSIVQAYYEYEIEERIIEEEMKLVKIDVDTFHFDASVESIEKWLVCFKKDTDDNRLGFHLNPYRFDSTDEYDVFAHLRQSLKEDEKILDIYFTGWTDKTSDTDFYFSYEQLENGEKKMGNYFPDFLIEVSNSKWEIKYLVIEVKGGDKRNDYQSAKSRYKTWETIENSILAKEIGFERFKEVNPEFEYRIVFDAKIPSEKTKTLDYIKTHK
jgi:type III restriction enzyme